MSRNITVTFGDGSSHVYQNTPDDVTPEQVTQRAQQEFSGRTVTALDGGRKPAGETVNYSPEPETGLHGTVTDTAPQSLGDVAAQSAMAVGGNLAQGVDAGLRFLAAPGKLVTDAIGSGIASVGDAVLHAGGFDNAADKFSHFFAPNDGPTLGALVKRVTPQATPGVETAAQLLGGAIVPFPGFKGAPKAASIPVAEDAAANAGTLADIVSVGKQAKVPVMTSDLRPPTTFMGKNAQSLGEKIPLLGTGGQRAAQQTSRIQAVKDVVSEFGGDVDPVLFDNAPSAIEDVAKNLSAKRSADLTRLTRAKNTVIEGTQGAVATPNAINAIDAQIAKLSGINETAYAPVINKLNEFKQVLSSGKTLSQIEGNRKLLGAMFEDPSLAAIRDDGQKAISAIYGPLREDMGAFIKANGGNGAFARWKSANDQLAGMAGELSNAKLRNVLKTGEMTPENVGKLLFSKDRSDVARLYANLDDTGKARAQAAILQRAFDKAISADNGLSVERFVNNLNTMSDGVGVTFRGADKERIAGLTRLLDVTRRASAAAAHPPTGVQNQPAAVGYTISQLFGAAAIPVAAAGGLLARAYESAPVRNLLIGLSKTKPGSAGEAALVSRLQALIPREVPIAAQNINDNFVPSPGSAAAQDAPDSGREPPQQ